LAVDCSFQRPRTVSRTSTYDKVRVDSLILLVFQCVSQLFIAPLNGEEIDEEIGEEIGEKIDEEIDED